MDQIGDISVGDGGNCVTKMTNKPGPPLDHCRSARRTQESLYQRRCLFLKSEKWKLVKGTSCRDCSQNTTNNMRIYI